MNATATATLNISTTSPHVVTGATVTSGGSLYFNFVTGGMVLDSVNVYASPGTLEDGLWMQGVANPYIGHYHCEGMAGYCEHYAAGQQLLGGVFATHDSLVNVAGLMDLGLGADNNQVFTALQASVPPTGTTNIVNDEKNQLTLTTSNYSNIAEYLPGSLLVGSNPGATIQGQTLYGHLNNANSANSGTCTINGTNTCGGTTGVSFTPPWQSAPACTATWISGLVTGVLIETITASSLKIASSVPGDSGTVAYHCEGNPN